MKRDYGKDHLVNPFTIHFQKFCANSDTKKQNWKEIIRKWNQICFDKRIDIQRQKFLCARILRLRNFSTTIKKKIANYIFRPSRVILHPILRRMTQICCACCRNTLEYLHEPCRSCGVIDILGLKSCESQLIDRFF